MSTLRAAQLTWDQLEPSVLRFLLRVLLGVAAIISAPFLALAFLFFLLDKPLLWVWIPLGIAAAVGLVALLAWLFARSRLRFARGHLDRAAAFEEALRGNPPPPP